MSQGDEPARPPGMESCSPSRRSPPHTAAAAADDPPYTLAREGFFHVGGKLTMVDGRSYMAGQMYVDFRIPAKQTHPYPIIMVHGGTRSATTYFGTPDGREGWAQYFVRQGYAVYVVDQPGRGRSGYLAESYGPWKVPDAEGGQRRYLSQAKYKLWPQAHLHTQWPGSGAPDDPVTLQMISGYLPEVADFTKQQFLNRDALVALIDKIGPAVLMVHSQAGAFGWPVADATARPGQGRACDRAQRPAVLSGRFRRRPRLLQAGATGAAVRPHRRAARLLARGQGRQGARRRCRRRSPTGRGWCAASCRRSRRASCPT